MRTKLLKLTTLLSILATPLLGEVKGPGWHNTPIDFSNLHVIELDESAPPAAPQSQASTAVKAPAAAAVAGAGVGHEVTPEIAALARGLLNDPMKIYDFVHNKIDYAHYFGLKKGAQLT
ncbi:MAG: hypothetical protein GY727_08820, partial [Gammaproteobacteria bacterium]|nr:hypothetical protein [Gammaproteobacteria bacterium]